MNIIHVSANIRALSNRFLRAAFVLPMLFAGPAALAEDASAGPPPWFLQHMEFLTQGRWITDNSQYKSESEPFDAYGMEYEKGIGGKSVRGRLFGLIDNKEVATFWEFHTVWHPAENRVLAFQFGGDGTYAVGPMIATGEHSHRMEQVFYSPNGSSRSSGHETDEAKDGSFITRSFDISADGSWHPQRAYTWRVATP